MRNTFLAGIAALSMATPALAQAAGDTPPTPDPAAASLKPVQSQPGLFSQQAIIAELAAARAWMEVALVDYESARFRDVRVVLVSPDRRNRRNVILTVCGLVNTRNRMGGFVGFQPFWFSSGMTPRYRGGLSGSANDFCQYANPVSATDYSRHLSPDNATGASSE